MTNTEIAYLAGIIDGEGSIMLTRINKNEYPCPCISISSTDIELLEWVKDKIGAGKINKKKNYNVEKHKTCYTYSIWRDKAIDVMKLISPYLIINNKRDRAKFIVDNYKTVTIRNGRYNEKTRKAKEQFYMDFMAL